MWQTGDHVKHRLDGATGSIQHFSVLGRTCSRKRAMAHPFGEVVVWADGTGATVAWAIRECQRIAAPMLGRPS